MGVWGAPAQGEGYPARGIRCLGMAALIFGLSLVWPIQAWAQERTLKIACNEFPPHKMEKSADGLPGFDVEILHAALTPGGLKPEIGYFPWKRALEYTRRGLQDGLCSCSRDPARDEWLMYSEDMGNVGVGVFVLATGDTPAIGSIRDLRDLNVAVVRGYNLHDELARENISTTLVADDDKGARMLMHRRVDAFYTFRDTGRYFLARLGLGQDWRYIEFRNSPYYFCVNKFVKDAGTIIKSFNLGLRKIRADGSYDRIMAKYR